MAIRRLLQVAVLALCVGTACNSKSKSTGGGDRCEQLAKTCGDTDKHIEKLAEECKAALQQQTDKGCADKANAVFDCYEKEVCGKADKVWTINDLRVLADRQKKCTAERDAGRECMSKK